METHEANVSPNVGTLKTNLRYSGNWGRWDLQREKPRQQWDRSRAQEAFAGHLVLRSTLKGLQVEGKRKGHGQKCGFGPSINSHVFR